MLNQGGRPLTSPGFPVRQLAANGLEAWKQVIERNYEGYVAKNEASAYENGRTSR
jgi:ATP-dependent DNA ligase